MKLNLFDLPGEERERILEMHKSATSRLYLTEQQTTGTTDFKCDSTTVNITNDIGIKIQPRLQKFGDRRQVEPNKLINTMRTTGNLTTAPIVYVRNLVPGGTSTQTQQNLGKASKIRKADNVWLSKIEYVKLEEVNNPKMFVYYPTFLTLSHMFCADFDKPEVIASKPGADVVVDIRTAVQGTQVYNYYRFPIIQTNQLGIETLKRSGLNERGSLDGALRVSTRKENLGNIPTLLYGENYQGNRVFNQDTITFFINEIVSNQPK